MLRAVRVVLLLTVGLPVFATQLVAFAMPRVEVVRFVPWQQLREEISENAEDTTKTPARASMPLLVSAPVSAASPGFVAAKAPADSSARALRFVVLRHRQAI